MTKPYSRPIVRRRPGGFGFLDVTLATAMVATMLVLLSVTLNRQHEASAAFAAQRDAVARAEAALTQLQAGEPIDLSQEPITLEPTPTVPPRENWVWVRVRVELVEPNDDGATATLLGVAPATAVEGSQP